MKVAGEAVKVAGEGGRWRGGRWRVAWRERAVAEQCQAGVGLHVILIPQIICVIYASSLSLLSLDHCDLTILSPR